jgi:hypothetical protein
MTLRELVPFLQQLNRAEKLYAIQLLVAELAKEENNLVQQSLSVVDQSDTWTEQDRLDIASFSLQYAATFFPDSEEIAS